MSKGRRSDYWTLRPVCAVHLGRRRPLLPLMRPPTAQSQSEGIQCDSANRVQTQRQSYAAQTLTHSKGNLRSVSNVNTAAKKDSRYGNISWQKYVSAICSDRHFSPNLEVLLP